MNDTWLDRMANELSVLEGSLVPGMAKAALEAAGEMKCVALKIALARCWEIVVHAIHAGDVPHVSDQFLAEIRELLK